MDPKSIYKERSEGYDARVDRLQSVMNIVAIARFISFILAIVMGYSLFGVEWWIGTLAFITLLTLFIVLVKWSLKLARDKRFNEFLRDINSEELQAMDHNYSIFPPGDEYTDQQHPYAYDLDIFGQGSLYQCLHRCTTKLGSRKMAYDLSSAMEPGQTVTDQQEALKELVGLLDWRQEFQALGREFSDSNEDEEKIIEWIGEKTYYLKRPLLRLLRYLLPSVTIVLLSMVLLNIVDLAWLILFAILQFGMVMVVEFRRINKIYRKIGNRYRMLNKYYQLIAHIEGKEFNSGLLREFKGMFISGSQPASMAIKKLAAIVNRFDQRNNMLAGVLLNTFLLWDLQCVMQLEKWLSKHRDEIMPWLDALASFDVIISYSSFAFNNPEYAYPEISDGQVLDCNDLGHPLISTENRVVNDFQMDEDTEFTIITGANMAGKSTFLRTVGLNMLLAQKGLPVCASKFNFPFHSIYTSMRTVDSLQMNESYFYAELKRLQILMNKIKGGQKIFVILDELLKGTNSKDKERGSRMIMEQLLELPTNGIVATHDLSLTDLEKDYPGRVRNMCFEIEISGERISFDYKLKPGATRRMNATHLMKEMGLGEV